MEELKLPLAPATVVSGIIGASGSVGLGITVGDSGGSVTGCVGTVTGVSGLVGLSVLPELPFEPPPVSDGSGFVTTLWAFDELLDVLS